MPSLMKVLVFDALFPIFSNLNDCGFDVVDSDNLVAHGYMIVAYAIKLSESILSPIM